jgi:hypothetical protein
VVIPSLAESKRLFDTLAGLAANPSDSLGKFLVIVVVNHRQDAPEADKRDNLLTLDRLEKLHQTGGDLRLAWVDAASPGLEFPLREGGVGLARKIGMDLALECLHEATPDPILVCLDADTLVQPDYLPALLGHFARTEAGGAVIPFSHQPGDGPKEEEAIIFYELYLRSYVLGLSMAGSPYAFHTVGSAMACRASGYAKAGGMNKRLAGEDFYFLQQLKKTSKVEQLRGTMVHPSPRPSHRVPFGTGRTVSKVLSGESDAITFYQPVCYRLLAAWLDLVTHSLHSNGKEIMNQARSLSPHLADYLETQRFAASWDRLRSTHRTEPSLLKAFHDWFDAFRTMQLIHHLSATAFPRGRANDSLPQLLAWGGLEPATEPLRQLEILRRRENLSA